MIDYKNIKAILFDSGRTLNVPRTGHWFITPKFHEILDTFYFENKQDLFDEAMQRACNHVNKIPFVKTEEDEFLMFKEFYRIFLEETAYPRIDDSILEALARDNVYNDEKFLFFDDVEPSLKRLSQKYILGVVSDTWPSLDRVFINAGLKGYFSTFVMSSIHGSLKAEKLLFEIALAELKIKPQEAVFVDDSESNLIAAEESGMIPVLIDRYNTENLESRYTIIRSLEELEGLLSI